MSGKPPAEQDIVRRVGRRIAELRVTRALTQEALAARLGIATKNLQRIESGRQNLTLRTMDAVAHALEVDPIELLRSSPRSITATSDLALLDAVGVRLWSPEDHDIAKSVVPVMSLQAAASRLAGGSAVEQIAWASLPGQQSPISEGSFLARVKGKSMEPLIPDGAWCLFEAPVRGPLVGRVVLIQHRDLADPDTGGAYAVKRVGGFDLQPPEELTVRLDSLNVDFAPIHLSIRSGEDLRAVAVFVKVVAPRPSRRTSPRALPRK